MSLADHLLFTFFDLLGNFNLALAMKGHRPHL
jgi:hypothetical protein